MVCIQDFSPPTLRAGITNQSKHPSPLRQKVASEASISQQMLAHKLKLLSLPSLIERVVLSLHIFSLCKMEITVFKVLYYRLVLSNFSKLTNHLGDLVKMQILL